MALHWANNTISSYYSESVNGGSGVDNKRSLIEAAQHGSSCSSYNHNIHSDGASQWRLDVSSMTRRHRRYVRVIIHSL